MFKIWTSNQQQQKKHLKIIPPLGNYEKNHFLMIKTVIAILSESALNISDTVIKAHTHRKCSRTKSLNCTFKYTQVYSYISFNISELILELNRTKF